jgi:protein SCO1/2
MVRSSARRGAARAALLLCAFAASPAARAEPTAELRRELARIGVEERLGARLPAGLVLRENDGAPLPLDGLAGRPLLLSFNYTSCARLCSVQLAGIAQALRDARWDGTELQVLTVSIDPSDTDELLREYERTFVRLAGGGDALGRAWRFASAPREVVDALAAAVGFTYRYEPRTGEFAHQATLVVVAPDLRVSSYLHGVRYEPEAFAAALARAGAGRIATPREQEDLGGFLLACVGFDPSDPLPLALKIMRASGGAVLLFLLLFVGAHALRSAPHPPARTAP